MESDSYFTPQQIKDLIQEKSQRLFLLEQRRARMGHSTPPEVLIEIDDLTKEIEGLKRRLANLESQLPVREGQFDAGGLDFVIVTALEKEAQAIVSRLENPRIERDQQQDIRTYHCGAIPITGTDRTYQVVVVLLPNMGELPAATATTDAIVRWKPQFVLMVGIAAGIPSSKDDRELGDVVVADQVIGYEHAKVTDKGYEYREREYPASALLLDRVRNFWDTSWIQQIVAPRPTNAKRNIPKLHTGPVASGNKVVASTEFRGQLTTRWPKLVAVEMEAEGVFSAVFDRPQIRNTLMIRGICDLADERKSDEWQEYAADAAASFAVSFLKSGPVEPRLELR
jgi:nucleoside phosphorylase